MRKFIWPLALVLVIAVLAGGGVWLSQRGQDGMKAGTLITETASEAMVGRTTEVRVPWGNLQVTVSEPIESTPEGRQAGHGSSLVGVQVTMDGAEDRLLVDRLPDAALQDPTFTLVADGDEYVLDGLVGWIGEEEIAQVARRQYVALRGEPTQVSLRVGYDGVDQVVDAQTGQLDRAGAQPLYQLGFAGGGQPCGAPLWSPDASDSGTDPVPCLVASSALRPYVAGLGWAQEGRSWMVITLLQGERDTFEGPDGTYDVADSETTYILDGQDPEDVHALNEALPLGAAEDANDPQVIIFDVDAERATGQFEVRTSLTGKTEVVTGKKGGGKKGGPKTSTEEFEALVAEGAFV